MKKYRAFFYKTANILTPGISTTTVTFAEIDIIYINKKGEIVKVRIVEDNPHADPLNLEFKVVKLPALPKEGKECYLFEEVESVFNSQVKFI